MADKQTLLRIKRTMRKDRRVKKLDTAFADLHEFNLPIRALYEEVESIHKVRKTRTLDRHSDTFTHDVVEGLLDDTAKRARLTEILVMCVKVLSNLKDTLGSLEGYMIIEYATELRSIPTKGERTNFLSHHVLSKFHKYVGRVERIKAMTELVMVDIDKASYAYSNLMKAIQLAAGRRETL